MTCKSLALWGLMAESFDLSPKDVASVERRSAEGLTFFTSTLPQLGKDLDRALESGQLEITAPFKKQRGTCYPQIMNAFWKKIFAPDGALLPDACTSSIRIVRQMCYLFYKLSVPFTPEQEEEAVQQFVDVDNSIPCVLPVESEVVGYFRSLFPDFPEDMRPHHSGGATADKLSHAQRRIRHRILPSLGIYPLHEYLFYNHDHVRQHLKWPLCETLAEDPPARLHLVNKDSRGPRKICIEPHEKMYFQKGHQENLYDYIEHHSPARGHVNFTDQQVNRDLARLASMDRKYATIDLKDASDLVPWHLVAQCAPAEWVPHLEATRSSQVELLDGSRHKLRKFAAMGSALCFPIEAMLFWAILRPITSDIYVYGDDIIIPNSVFDIAVARLQAYGLVVNTAKSLTHGFFRESCGGEYYKGADIGVLRYKSFEPVQHIAFLNNLTRYYGSIFSDAIARSTFSKVNVRVYSEPLEYSHEPRSLVYYTNDLDLLSNIGHKYRVNTALNVIEVRRLVNVVRRENPLISYPNGENSISLHREDKGPGGYYGLLDWMTRKASSRPLDEMHRRLYDWDGSGSAPAVDLLNPDKLPAYGRVKTRTVWRWEICKNLSYWQFHQNTQGDIQQ